MSLTGPGSVTAASVQAVNKMFKQLDTLSTQLATGKKAQTYSDLASQAGLALQLSAQLAALDGYSSTATTVGTTLGIAEGALTQIDGVGTAVKQSVSQQGSFTLDGNGQTATQAGARAQLDEVLSLLSTRVGSSYLFSGSALDQPSVAGTDVILDGNGTQAGLTQVIAERQQADLGSNGLGRLSIPPAGGSSVSISEDVAGSPFGFKLAGVSSTLTGATVSGPSGSPASIGVNFTSNPNDGDTIKFVLKLPDGTSEAITLQATMASPPSTNQFTIGATPAVTAGNLQAALTSAVGTLAQTALPAASAVAAAHDFFADPPQRVAGSPPDTATALTDGTSADTVIWYTGESGSTPARQTAVAQVGPSITIAYGLRANEPAITSLLATIGALAATTYSASDPNAAASYQALSQRVITNLDGQSSSQSIGDIETDLANAQTAMDNAGKLNTQTQSTLTDLLQNIDGVSQAQIGEQLLTLQNALSASLSVTARLAQMSLVNYLGPVG